jgi:hypothetical protein
MAIPTHQIGASGGIFHMPLEALPWREALLWRGKFRVDRLHRILFVNYFSKLAPGYSLSAHMMIGKYTKKPTGG